MTDDTFRPSNRIDVQHYNQCVDALQKKISNLPDGAVTMTEKPKHTPGPWRIEEYHEVFEVYGAAGETILDSFLSILSGEAFGVVARNADARLIAAAPELIAALEDMIECVDVLERIWGNRVGKKDIWREAIMPVFCATNSYNKAKEAIKRAKGEES